MRPYLESYFDLYWDLHLGVKGDAIPQRVQADRRKLQHRPGLSRSHPEDRLRQLHDGPPEPRLTSRRGSTTGSPTSERQDPEPEKTFAWYWLKNGGEGEYFAHKDVVFEVLPQFRGAQPMGQHAVQHHAQARPPTPAIPDTRTGSRRPWKADPDDADGQPSPRSSASSWNCSAPSRRTAEAFRRWRRSGHRPISGTATSSAPHTSTSLDPVHWTNPDDFDPDRYNTAPTSHEIDEAQVEQIGFAKCPFDQTSRSRSRTDARPL